MTSIEATIRPIIKPENAAVRALDAVADKVQAGQRIEEQEARDLYACTDLLELGRLASIAAQRRPFSHCTLIPVRRIRYSNICRNQCRHCDRAKKPDEEGAFTRTVSEVLGLVGEAVEAGMSQFQFVGGSSPDQPYEYYREMVGAVRSAFPDIHIQGFAPEQLASIAAQGDMNFEDVLSDLRSDGLDSILEDGADIFNYEIRNYLCPAKATGGSWLHTMREAHGLGFHTGASMLYGHFEGPEAKAEHLSLLRDLQDETGGFTFFAPRAFRQNGRIRNGNGLVGGAEDVREFAVSAIFLSNFPHIRCYANDLGMKTSQLAMQFGVDTIVVVSHDAEPLDDDARSAARLPNAGQLSQLMERLCVEIRTDRLDQRPPAPQE